MGSEHFIIIEMTQVFQNLRDAKVVGSFTQRLI